MTITRSYTRRVLARLIVLLASLSGPVNFASRITAPVMAGIGFIDTISPPAGLWTPRVLTGSAR